MKSQLRHACSEIAGQPPWLNVPWLVLWYDSHNFADPESRIAVDADSVMRKRARDSMRAEERIGCLIDSPTVSQSGQQKTPAWRTLAQGIRIHVKIVFR
jgi:hypothetical protein